MANTMPKSNLRNLIFLVHPGHIADEEPYMPYECLWLARFLLSHGFEVQIIDQRLELNWEERIRDRLDDVLWVGVTIITGPQIRYALETAKKVREIRETIPMVWGGWHATFVAANTIIHPLVDYVIAGIAETKILEVCEYIQGSEVGPPPTTPGILHKDGNLDYTVNKEQYDESDELPAYRLIDIEAYRSKNNVAGLITSRGCPFRCNYCVIQQIRFINRPIEAVVDEIEFLVRDQGFKVLRFADGLFFAQRNRVERIITRCQERGLKFKWQSNVRPETFRRWSKEGMDWLVDSGLDYVASGVESGSEFMLKRIQKDATVDDIFHLTEITEHYGIGLTLNFLSGLPHETIDDLKFTAEVIEKLKTMHSRLRIINPLYRPFPGAPTYDEMLRLGWTPPQSLEEWAETTQWNMGIETVDPFPWMEENDFHEYVNYFRNSSLSREREPVLLERQ